MTEQQAPLLEWDIEVPLLTNRFMVAAMAKAMIGAGLLVSALVGFGLAIQGEWHVILPVAGMLFCLACGLFLLALVIMAFPFRNRMAMRFAITDKGLRMQTIDRTARIGNRTAFWAGVALGSAGTAGSGLLAQSQEDQQIKWSGAFTARYEPATRTIAFSNGWRTLVRVYCLPENYQQAVAIVGERMAAGGAAARVSARSPLGGYLLRTLLVVVCCIPLFAVSEMFAASSFIPWLMLCFAIAMVWLVRYLAWVTLGCLAVQAAIAIGGMNEVRQSMFSLGTYRRYEVLSGDDWAIVVLARSARPS